MCVLAHRNYLDLEEDDLSTLELAMFRRPQRNNTYIPIRVLYMDNTCI